MHLQSFRNGLYFLVLFQCFLGNVCAADPLPSWNEGPIKKALLGFVKEAAQEGGSNFIPIKERIAAFDEDGTLWVEQPVYVEYFFVLDTIREQASKHPEWANTEPFKSVLTHDDEAIKKFTMHEIAQLLGAAQAGMSVEAFRQNVNDWLKKAVHPRYKRPFTELVYEPMLEAMQFLKDNQFEVYIVSGGGQEFIRAFAETLYDLPPGRIIGTAGKVEYEYQEGHPLLLKLPKVLFINDKEGKPEGINLIIGKRPVIAFGNSIGDQQMLEWTQGQKGKTLELLVHHDDPEREYAYGPDSKIGTFSNALMDEAKNLGWQVISMKNDWKILFPWQKLQQQ